MELKGKNLNKVPRKKRKKMEKTLQRMTDARIASAQKLRERIKLKIDWAQTEKKKGLSLIEAYYKQIDMIRADAEKRVKEVESNIGKVKDQVHRIEGTIMAMTDLQNEDSVITKEEEDKVKEKKQEQDNEEKK
jgi:hypothetical protein